MRVAQVMNRVPAAPLNLLSVVVLAFMPASILFDNCVTKFINDTTA
jgi:hypothetical protein